MNTPARDCLWSELLRLKAWRREFEANDSDVGSRIREIEQTLFPPDATETRKAAA